MLMKALHDNDVLNGVLLGANGMGDRGAKAVADLVRNNKNVETVFLGCNMIREEGIEALTSVLHGNMHVRSLWVKRNPLELAGAKSMAEMLRNNTHLRTLDLVQTRIDEAGAKVVIDALVEGNKTLQRLYLGGLGLTSNFAPELNRLLEGADNVTDLFISSNKLGDTGIEILSEGIKSSTTLRVLGLDSNGITHEGLEPLMEALWNHPSLKRLSLGFAANTKPVGASANCFRNAGASHVANMLKFNTTLHTLTLDNTQIGNQGATEIANAIRKSNKTLVTLKLSRNAIDRATKKKVKRVLVGRQPKKLDPTGADLDTFSIQSFYRNPKTTSFCPTLVVKTADDDEDDFEVLDRLDYGCNAESDDSESEVDNNGQETEELKKQE